MKSFFLKAGRLAAIAAGSAAVLSAADQGFGAELRLRGGIQFEEKDNLNRYMVGFSLAGSYGLNFGTLTAEAGYQFKPGSQWKEGYQAPYAGAPVVEPLNSADSRRNSLEGLTLRLGFEKDLPWKDFSWQAGVQIASARFRHEYIADIGDANWATYEDTYNGTPTKSVIAFNPFVRVRYRAGAVSTFELNVISVGYKSINFQHTPGSPIVAGDPNVPGSHLVYEGDTLIEKSRNALHLEFGYSFRF